ncbi:MAG: inosine/xanthosine triphosphatase [Cyclobacteriaceae bacterium]|nr:inosine/xanthosine triphosphatase [Cyclobacteriaceae bacterium]
MKKRVVVASKNPVKLKSTKDAFEKVFGANIFDFIPTEVPSGVGDQPLGTEETLNGARNRAHNARKLVENAHYWIGIEGGVRVIENGMEAFAWVYIFNEDMEGKAQTASFQLPPEVVKLISEGMELGHADDLVFRRKNSKQGNGAVGLLTGDLIDRVAYYAHAVVLALVPFMNPSLYKLNNG